MTRRRIVLASLASAGLVVLLCCGAGYFWLYLLIGVNDAGSASLAEEWKLVLEPLGNVEDATQKEPLVQGKRFADGDWVFGLCRDSHGRFKQGGGTLVVKDSRGKVRAFFGHVCGWLALETMLREQKSLDEFYKYLLEQWQFQEYQWTKETQKETQKGTGNAKGNAVESRGGAVRRFRSLEE